MYPTVYFLAFPPKQTIMFFITTKKKVDILFSEHNFYAKIDSHLKNYINRMLFFLCVIPMTCKQTPFLEQNNWLFRKYSKFDRLIYISRYMLEMSLSWNFPARASPSYEGTEPSRAGAL